MLISNQVNQSSLIPLKLISLLVGKYFILIAEMTTCSNQQNDERMNNL